MKTFKDFTEEEKSKLDKVPTFYELISAVSIIKDSLEGLTHYTDEYHKKVDDLYYDCEKRLKELQEH